MPFPRFWHPGREKASLASTNDQIRGNPVEKRSGVRTFCSDPSAVVGSEVDDSGKDCRQGGQDFQ